MRAAEVLMAAQAAGIAIGVDGGDLVLEASEPPPTAVVDLLKAHKAGIIALLSDGAVPWAWARGVAMLSKMPPATTIPPERWRQIVCSANTFLVRWGHQAAALGWETLDIFGAHWRRPLARYDAAGLVILLDGAQVVAITADTAEIRTRTGGRQCYARRAFTEPGQVALWELNHD